MKFGVQLFRVVLKRFENFEKVVKREFQESVLTLAHQHLSNNIIIWWQHYI